MKKLLYAVFIIINLTSCTSCEEVHFEDNVKLSAEGFVKDAQGNPIENYPLEIRAVFDKYDSLDNYSSTFYRNVFDGEYVNTAYTDENGRFLVFFPKTNAKELLLASKGDSLIFIFNGAQITSEYMVLKFEDYNANVGSINIK